VGSSPTPGTSKPSLFTSVQSDKSLWQSHFSVPDTALKINPQALNVQPVANKAGSRGTYRLRSQ